MTDFRESSLGVLSNLGIGACPPVKAWVEAPRFCCLMLRSYDHKIHVEGLLPVNLCLVSLLSLEQCSQFERSQL